ncbi:MAG: prepilin-type N-terminal cleavage/methylation domain-containing protein [Planctomycetota bacterium]
MNLTVTPHARSLPAARPSRRRGFTLSEVLVAIGILALGTVAVASLFPTAAFLQKEAVKETLRQNHVRSADAILEGVGLRNQTLLDFTRLIETKPAGYPAYDVRNQPGAVIDDPAFDVFALSEVDVTVDSDPDPSVVFLDPAFGGAAPDMRMGMIEENHSYVYDSASVYTDGPFPVAFRSLPSTTPPTGADGYINREVFWVPLVRAGLEASELYPDWSVYVFVLQPDSQLRRDGVYTLNPADPDYGYGDFNNADIVCANPDTAADYFPKVFRVPVAWNSANPNRATPTVNLFGYVKPGEKVLGDNGVIYRVSQIAPPGSPDAGTMILAEDTEYSPINQRDLGAVWVAPAPGGLNQNSPLADIRLLSNTVVRTNDF